MKKGFVAFLSGSIGAIAGALGAEYLSNKSIIEKSKKVDKFKSYYNMLNQWLILKQTGKSLEQYFVDQGYKSIAIYGMGEMGNRLYDELKDSSIEVKYSIDSNAGNTYSELEVLGLEDDLPEVDVVVVTAIFAYEEIEKNFTEVSNYNLISLEEVIYGI